MSKRTLELLADLDLIDRKGKIADLSRRSDSDLRDALGNYFQIRMESADAEQERLACTDGEFATLVSSISASNTRQSLLPSALVYDRIFCDDPLFPLTVPRNLNHEPATQIFGLVNDHSLDREALQNSLEYFAELGPLIRDKAVCVLPVSVLHRPSGDLPILFSEDGFASEVPEHIREFVHESAIINDVEVDASTGRMVIYHRPPSGRKRMMSLSFQDDFPNGPGTPYFLSQMRGTGEIRDGKIRVEQTFDPSNAPDETTYTAWVNQSINRTVLNRLRFVSSELRLADRLGAYYVTQSDFEAKLFSLSCDKALPTSSRENAVNFLRSVTPFLSVDSPALVASLRSDNRVLFEKFHASLLHIASQLTGVDEGFEEKARQLYVKEVEPQVQAINAQLSKTRSQVISGAAGAAAATALAILKFSSVPFVSELSVLVGAGALTALGAALPNITEYMTKRRTPAFIWSQLAKE